MLRSKRMQLVYGLIVIGCYYDKVKELRGLKVNNVYSLLGNAVK